MKNDGILILGTSALLTAALFYFEEETHSFYFLTELNELLNYFIFTVLTGSIPLLILASTEKRKGKFIRFVPFVGFVPVGVLLVVVLLSNR